MHPCRGAQPSPTLNQQCIQYGNTPVHRGMLCGQNAVTDVIERVSKVETTNADSVVHNICFASKIEIGFHDSFLRLFAPHHLRLFAGLYSAPTDGTIVGYVTLYLRRIE